MISEESAALHETRLRWGCVWKGLGVIPGTSRGYNSSCHCPPQLSFHALVPAESSPPAVHLAAMSFIPAAEFEKENFLKSSISLETDAASALSRYIKYIKPDVFTGPILCKVLVVLSLMLKFQVCYITLFLMHLD